MTAHYYFHRPLTSQLTGCLLAAVGLLSTAGTAQAQAPTLTTFSPPPNANAVSPTSTVRATFSQPLLASSAQALHVYSARQGGRRTGISPALVQGNSLSYTPVMPFLPGETVFTTVTQAVASATGTLGQARVQQFTVAVGGTGRGSFPTGTDPVASAYAFAEAVGDVDGDGDLDILTADQGGNTVRVELNGGNAAGSGRGIFSLGSTVTVGTNPYGLAMGDVDGDGDLDLVTANFGGTSSVSVRLNGGDATGSHTGLFSNGSEVAALTNAYGVNLNDVDGDGDLDLIIIENNAEGKVTIRLNGGDATGSATGVFGQGSSVRVDPGPFAVATGDVDNDGDLDLVVTHYSQGRVRVLLNGGDNTGSQTGFFSQGSTLLLAGSPYGLALGDIDGDGDLDLAVTNVIDNLVSLRLNGGDNTGSATGVFSQGTDVTVGSGPISVALGDVDADGDLDLVTANGQGQSGSVRLNGGNATGSGTGLFSGGSTVPVARRVLNVVLADVDGDQDLDVLLATEGNVSVRLNQPTPPLASAQAHSARGTQLLVSPTVVEGGQVRYEYAGSSALGAQAVLEIYTLTGQRVWAQSDGVAPRGTLMVPGLRQGVYLLRLSTGSATYLTRFVQP